MPGTRGRFRRPTQAGEWSARQVLEHMLATQEQYLDMVRAAMQDASPVEKD